MDKRKWCTMEDVQEDLARATGQRLPALDEGFLVYGERPPPPRIFADEDSELELQLGGAPAGAGPRQPPPDLCGITKMLRMVQNYGSGDRAKGSDTPTSTNDVIVISKPIVDSSSSRELTTSPSANDRDSILASNLNPNVKEFVPRIKTPSCSSQMSEDGAVKLEIDPVQHGKSLSLHRYQIERDELAAMLKSRIYSAPQDDSCEFQRQKYAAIANLLKLRAAAAPSPEPPLLRTPAYFRTSAADSDRGNIASTPAEEEKRTEGAHRSEAIATRAPQPAAADERDVRASIHKVNNWLDSEPCVPAASARSPRPAPHERKQRPPAASAYVPSAHAQELGRQYAARAGAAPPPPPPGLWERVRAELRRREASAS